MPSRTDGGSSDAKGGKERKHELQEPQFRQRVISR